MWHQGRWLGVFYTAHKVQPQLRFYCFPDGVSRMHWEFSQNPTMVWVGKDLVDLLAPTFLPGAGIYLLDQLAQGISNLPWSFKECYVATWIKFQFIQINLTETWSYRATLDCQSHGKDKFRRQWVLLDGGCGIGDKLSAC